MEAAPELKMKRDKINLRRENKNVESYNFWKLFVKTYLQKRVLCIKIFDNKQFFPFYIIFDPFLYLRFSGGDLRRVPHNLKSNFCGSDSQMKPSDHQQLFNIPLQLLASSD